MPKQFNGRKNSLFNKCCWNTWITECKRIKVDPYLTSCTRIYSKGIRYLNVRAKTTKLLGEENTGAQLHYFGLGNGFLDMIPKQKPQKEK